MSEIEKNAGEDSPREKKKNGKGTSDDPPVGASNQANIRWAELCAEVRREGRSPSDLCAVVTRVWPGEPQQLGTIPGSVIQGSINEQGFGEAPAEAFTRYLTDAYHGSFPERAKYEVEFRWRADARYKSHAVMNLAPGPEIVAVRNRQRQLETQQPSSGHGAAYSPPSYTPGFGAAPPQYGAQGGHDAHATQVAQLRAEVQGMLNATLTPLIEKLGLGGVVTLPSPTSPPQATPTAPAAPPAPPLTAEAIAAAVADALNPAKRPPTAKEIALEMVAAMKAAGIGGQGSSTSTPPPAAVGAGATPTREPSLADVIGAYKKRKKDVEDFEAAVGIAGGPEEDTPEVKAEIVDKPEDRVGWKPTRLGDVHIFGQPFHIAESVPKKRKNEFGELVEEDEEEVGLLEKGIRAVQANPVIIEKVVEGSMAGISKFAAAAGNVIQKFAGVTQEVGAGEVVDHVPRSAVNTGMGATEEWPPKKKEEQQG